MRFDILLSALAVGRAVNGLTAPYRSKTPPLTSRWTDEVGTNPWREYPRPQLVREQWQSLNGIWSYQDAGHAGAIDHPPSGKLKHEVMIPSCLESGLSGIMAPVSANGSVTHSWFQTEFHTPEEWAESELLLHFDAVDYEATVFINIARTHRGGYTRFSVDITELVDREGPNELVVFVYDPTDGDGEVIPIGKQTNTPSHIFYTPCTGIWQSVWIEPVPRAHIEGVDIMGDMFGKVNMSVRASQPSDVSIKVLGSKGNVLASAHGEANTYISFKVPDIKQWSPETPHLYDIEVKLGDDVVRTYTAFRTVGREMTDGVMRPTLNGDFTFTFGLLDQGYWPDGIYTPPSPTAMRYDLQFTKALGFNMVRKHIKVEPDLWYRACDEMGLLVIQDMPSMPMHAEPTDEQQAEFARQMEEMIITHRSFPSIWTWTIYNEGWGQRWDKPQVPLAAIVRALDPTRLVNAASGWRTLGTNVSDYSDNHHYTFPQCGVPWYSTPGPFNKQKIGFQGEFGGVGMNVSEAHLWKVDQAITAINETFELCEDIEAWNYRTHQLLGELASQTATFACSGGVYTQLTDVEGEVNGLVTYDRRSMRLDEKQWRKDIQALYDAAHSRGAKRASAAGIFSPGFRWPDTIDSNRLAVDQIVFS